MTRRRRRWTLLIVPDGDQAVRQYRIAWPWVLLALGMAVALVIYAAAQTYLFWVTAARARQVVPLQAKVRDLEGSSRKLAELGAQLDELKSFEAQLRRSLLAHLPDTVPEPASEPGLVMGVGHTYRDAGMAPWIETNAEPSFLRGLQEHIFTPADLPSYPPVRGYVTRAFQRSGARAGGQHLGIDFAARAGTPVVAAASGLVIFADWTYLYGNLVVLVHRSGYASFYGHNEVLLVSVRRQVEQGQPIALLGTSGRSSAPHLHFEIWRAGEPIDPLALLVGE